MTNETIGKLVEALRHNESLQNKIISAKTLEEKARIFVENGHEISAEELEGCIVSGSECELSDCELSSIAAGVFWIPIKILNPPPPAGPAPVPIPYPNTSDTSRKSLL